MTDARRAIERVDRQESLEFLAKIPLQEAHFLHRLRMEGIVCGPGGRYNTMPDERVDVPGYLDMIRINMLAMLDVCEVA